VKIAPFDATIFSDQTVAFMTLNQDAVSALLGRSLPDGGGDTFYNLASAGGDASRLWIQIEASTLRADAASLTPSFRSDATGVDVGGDVTVAAGLRLGVALGYDKSWLSDGDGGSANEELFRASLYGSQSLGPIGLSGAVSWAHAWDHTDRATGAGPAVASRTTNDLIGAIQASAPFTFSGVTASPSVGVVVSHLSGASFAEFDPVDEGAFAVTGQGVAQTFVAPFAKIGLSRAFVTSSGLTWTPDVEAGYREDASARGGAFTLTAADGTVFYGNRAALDRGAGLLGASLTLHRNGWTLYVKYRAEVASGWTDQSFAAGLRIAF
jgi:outer membrane autotransporter protein